MFSQCTELVTRAATRPGNEGSGIEKLNDIQQIGRVNEKHCWRLGAGPAIICVFIRSAIYRSRTIRLGREEFIDP